MELHSIFRKCSHWWSIQPSRAAYPLQVPTTVTTTIVTSYPTVYILLVFPFAGPISFLPFFDPITFLVHVAQVFGEVRFGE
jgi:hypothetical protein